MALITLLSLVSILLAQPEVASIMPKGDLIKVAGPQINSYGRCVKVKAGPGSASETRAIDAALDKCDTESNAILAKLDKSGLPIEDADHLLAVIRDSVRTWIMESRFDANRLYTIGQIDRELRITCARLKALKGVPANLKATCGRYGIR